METIAERFDTATRSRARFTPGAVVLQDRGLWRGIRLERWDTPHPDALPESVLFQHGVVVNLDPMTTAETRFSGEKPIRTRFARESIVILPAGLPYSASSRSPWRGIVVGLEPTFVQSVVGASGARLDLRPTFAEGDAFIVQALHALARDVAEGGLLGKIYGESVGVALAAHLALHYAVAPSRMSGSLPGVADPRREHVRSFVLERLHEPLTLADMAELVGLDVYAFARWFKGAFGVPAHRYVLLARIERAKALLATSSIPLVDLALQCGFSSQSHLASTFRRFVGVSPKAYRAAR